MSSTATVLVVDDEPQVRHLIRRMLEVDPSCSVVEAEDGDTALAVVERDDPPVRVVLTDLMMPRLGGLAVLGALRVHRPDLPVLVMSGVAPEARTLRMLEEYRTRVIPKPFSLDALNAAVRGAIEGRSKIRHQAREARAESAKVRAAGAQICVKTGELLATARALQAEFAQRFNRTPPPE
jgi:DNA-binding NtrC family response regulator